MTPDARKKPLPTYRYPETSYEWKYALQGVKVAYLKGQWKSCASQCDALLSHCRGDVEQLYATYLHFYNALSVEATARQMSHLSVVKIETLEMSKELFQRAFISLPEPVDFFDDTRSSSTLSGSDGEGSMILEDSASSVDVTSPLKDYFPSNGKHMDMGLGCQLKPVPSKMRKATGNGVRFVVDAPDGNRNALVAADPDTPTRRTTTTSTNYSNDSPHEEFTEVPIRAQNEAALRRWNDELSDFARMLDKHISYIDDLIRTTREKQAIRHAVTLMSTAEEDGDVKSIGIQARIKRLREGNWERQRFDPTRYQRLCDTALEEL